MTPADRAIDLLREIVDEVAQWDRDPEMCLEDIGIVVVEKWHREATAILAEVEAAAKARSGC